MKMRALRDVAVVICAIAGSLAAAALVATAIRSAFYDPMDSVRDAAVTTSTVTALLSPFAVAALLLPAALWKDRVSSVAVFVVALLCLGTAALAFPFSEPAPDLAWLVGLAALLPAIAALTVQWTVVRWYVGRRSSSDLTVAG